MTIQKVYIGLTLLLFFFNSNALGRVHDYETTRLKSTAGAGVASLLVDEATILNPATLAFFELSAIYAQRYSSKTALQESVFNLEGYEDDNKSYGLILSDTKSMLKGSLSYLNQEEMGSRRKRFAVAVASSIGSQSAFGMTLRHSIEKEFSKETGRYQDAKYQQVIFGASHVLSEGLSVGMLIIDPLKKREEDTRLFLGGQYVFSTILSLIFDIGTNFYQELTKELILRGAVQINFFRDLYFRVGLFRDEILKERGEGLGFSWISPRLVFDAAVKTTRFLENREKGLRELSFSVSYRF